MTNSLRWCSIAVFLWLSGTAGPGWAEKPVPAANAPAPAAELDMAAFAGRVVLVDFWASWCKPCRASLPWLNEMQQKYGEQGLQVVLVNVDRKAKAAAKMARDIGPDIRQFLDPEGQLATAYGLSGMPSSYLYDRRGQLVAEHVGFLAAEAGEREQELVSILGAAVAP